MVQAPAIASIHKTPFQTGMPRGAGGVCGCLGVLWWETGVLVIAPPLLYR